MLVYEEHHPDMARANPLF